MRAYGIRHTSALLWKNLPSSMFGNMNFAKHCCFSRRSRRRFLLIAEGSETATAQEWTMESQNAHDRLINEEFGVWKSNAPFLYDLVLTKALEWPSLTCQWLPRENVSGEFHAERLLLGTHTSGGFQNYLMIADARLPSDSKLASNEGEGRGRDKGKIEVIQRIKHDGEVNRARCMSQNPSVVATKTITSDLFVFDTNRHPLSLYPDGKCKPQLRLRGHNNEGYGVSWSPKEVGKVVSGADDHLICTWDVQSPKIEGGGFLDPTATYKGHTDVVGDVAWHEVHPCLFGSVGDDSKLNIWDTREKDVNTPLHSVQVQKGGINCIAFCPFSEYLLATGSADSTVSLWDMRNLSSNAHSFKNHVDEILQIEWSPRNHDVFASASGDRRINVWNMSKIGAEQNLEDAAEGPPELLFIHGGHTKAMSDFSWNPNEPWVISSVAEDNMLQIWSVAEHIYEEMSTPSESGNAKLGTLTGGSEANGADQKPSVGESLD